MQIDAAHGIRAQQTAVRRSRKNRSRGTRGGVRRRTAAGLEGDLVGAGRRDVPGADDMGRNAGLSPGSPGPRAHGTETAQGSAAGLAAQALPVGGVTTGRARIFSMRIAAKKRAEPVIFRGRFGLGMSRGAARGGAKVTSALRRVGSRGTGSRPTVCFFLETGGGQRRVIPSSRACRLEDDDIGMCARTCSWAFAARCERRATTSSPVSAPDPAHQAGRGDHVDGVVPTDPSLVMHRVREGALLGLQSPGVGDAHPPGAKHYSYERKREWTQRKA